VAVLLLALSGGPRADAHAILVKSAPASRALLGYPPDRVQLWFNERLEPAFSGMSVYDAAGAQVDNRDAAVAPDDAKRLSVTLKPLSAGPYTVRFRVLSVDGHVVESTFPFTVKPASPAR
jgi:methionine-rich copper-binding protein CopC